MKRFIVFLVGAFFVLTVAGCCGAQRAATQAYVVDSCGHASAATRSALDGDLSPGKQEIIGFYLPVPGTGLAAKGGIEWDGTTTIFGPPAAASTAFAAGGCFAPASFGCAQAVAEDCIVPETYTVAVPEAYTVMVPQRRTRIVHRTATRLVRKVSIPVSQDCAPTPSAAECLPYEVEAADPCAPSAVSAPPPSGAAPPAGN